MTEPVDIARRLPDEEFPVYPEGARDKRRLYSPREAVHSFVVTDRRYLFKKPPWALSGSILGRGRGLPDRRLFGCGRTSGIRGLEQPE